MFENQDYIAIFPKRKSVKQCVLFDFDGTLAVKADGREGFRAESNPDNFVLLYGVESQIKKYIARSILVVIVSNQSHLTEAKLRMLQRFNAMFNNKLCVLIAHKQNHFRKPDVGFIELLRSTYGEGVKLSFYCGDAVGPTAAQPQYRWGDADKVFAQNAGLPFKTPIEVFGSNFVTAIPDPDVKLVIMMGNPGSGKTAVSKRLEKDFGFVRFSQDELPSSRKLTSAIVMKDIKQQLLDSKRVVVDATHASKESRQVWFDLARECGVVASIMWCILDGRVNNAVRTEHKVPAIAYNVYSKYFERPEEGTYIFLS